jgi:hypothetical protein
MSPSAVAQTRWESIGMTIHVRILWPRCRMRRRLSRPMSMECSGRTDRSNPAQLTGCMDQNCSMAKSTTLSSCSSMRIECRPFWQQDDVVGSGSILFLDRFRGGSGSSCKIQNAGRGNRPDWQKARYIHTTASCASLQSSKIFSSFKMARRSSIAPQK